MNDPGREVLKHAVFIAGPTSSGKSALAVEWARRHGGEIVCADAFQLYREFPVLSAQPSEAEREGVPHHLFGVVTCTDAMDAARYAQMALAVIAEIASRGRIPFVVGGSGLYIHALASGLPDLPPTDPGIRERVRAMNLQDMVRALGELDSRRWTPSIPATRGGLPGGWKLPAVRASRLGSPGSEPSGRRTARYRAHPAPRGFARPHRPGRGGAPGRRRRGRGEGCQESAGLTARQILGWRESPGSWTEPSVWNAAGNSRPPPGVTPKAVDVVPKQTHCPQSIPPL